MTRDLAGLILPDSFRARQSHDARDLAEPGLPASLRARQAHDALDRTRRIVWIDRDDYPLGVRLMFNDPPVDDDLIQSLGTVILVPPELFGTGALLTSHLYEVTLLTRWTAGCPVTGAGLPDPGPDKGERVHMRVPLGSPALRETVQTILDVAATGVPLGPPLLSAIGTALSETRDRGLTLAQRLFLSRHLVTGDDLPDGRKVVAGNTEPYPGAWPRAAVVSAVAGDMAALWPYLGDR